MRQWQSLKSQSRKFTVARYSQEAAALRSQHPYSRSLQSKSTWTPSVVPPPPPPPPLSSYGNGAVQGASTSPLEFNNTLSHPTGPEHRFLAGEGAYVLRSDLHLAAPPPHVPDGPLPSANPPTSTAYPLRTGTRLSLALTTPRKTASRPIKDDASFHPYFQTVQSNGSRSRQNRSSGDSDRVERGSDNSSTQPSSDAANGPSSSESGAAPVFGESNVLLSGPPAKDAPKRRKHKTNIVKSNSTFVSRVVAHETLSKRLQDHKPDGPFAFANVGRAMQWLDMSSSSAGEPLTKLLFSRAQPLCHDVNQLTRSSSSLDVVVGFSTGDILSYEPMSGKYARINKNGVITSSAVTEIRWVPGSENLFLAAHSDGTMIVYDKDKEDAPFMVSDETLFVRPQPAGSRTLDAGIQVIKSVNSPNQRCNPVAYWKLSYQRINAFAFSPDNKHLAVVSEDGTLRVVDHLKEAYVEPQPIRDADILTALQASRCLFELLRWLHLRLLVARRQVHIDGRARRPRLDMVLGRV